jgi:phage FluMu protein Com
MDSINLRCKKCQHLMKFAAAKAGKRAKCTKCGEILLIQADEAPTNEEPEAPPPPPAPPAANDPFGDESPGGYESTLDPELEERRLAREAEEVAKGKQRKKRDKLPSVTRKVKAIPEAEAWNKVRVGLLFIFIGTWIWLGCHILQGSYVLWGSGELPEYAAMLARNLEKRMDDENKNNGFPERGHGWDVDALDIYLGMIVGKDFLGFARLCLTLSSVFYFFHALCWVAGYGFLLPVPRRFGMFGQVLLMLALAVFNAILLFSFKLLPVLGAHGYVMIPLVTPEIAMTEYNMERMVPIHVLWAGGAWPAFFESVGCIIIKTLVYLEPTIMSVFVWSAGVAIKDDTIEQGGKGRVEMSLGTLFIIVCYHLLSLCGASPMLVIVLRVIYTLWFFFLIIFMLQFAMLMLKFRAVLYDKINPKNILEEEDEPKKKKKKKKD